jgi:hypothetical protein
VVGEVNHRALAEAALSVARQRAEQLREIRLALASGDESAALKMMRIYVGLEDEEQGDRAPEGIH